MGIILCRFRKKKTTYEVLEDLDTKIKEIQRYGQTTEQRHKKIVGTLIIYSVVLYIIAALVFYFYFFPASLRDRFFYITPLLIFPLLIILTKRMVTWYYKRKISRNQDKLSTMQKEKKKILEEVTEVETYKKAKEILMKFAPDQLRMTPLSPQPVLKPTVAITESPRRPSTPQAVVAPLPGGSELRRRALTVSNTSANQQIGRPANSGVAPIGFAPAYTPLPQTPFASGARLLNASTMGPRSPLPRPILPQQRSYLDRLVEYLVGDGPSNRYALICQQCDSHNGMALKEEFEYFGFRCCYCNFWNPARKQKPSAPKLEQDPLNSPLSSLHSGKVSEIDASSASSSSVQENSESPSNPSSPRTYDPIDVTELPAEPPIILAMHIPEVKSIDYKKRRRTIYQLKPHQDSSEHLQDNISELSPRRRSLKAPTLKSPSRKFDKTSRAVSETTFSLRDAPIDEPCTVETENRNLQCDSDIEVIEKPSQQSETDAEKDSNSEAQKADEKSSDDEGKSSTTEDTGEVTEKKEQEAQSEEMEVDESPKK